MAQGEARNVLISNSLSEIGTLATNQGVVGSNPAGRAIHIKGLQRCDPFSLATLILAL